MTSQFVLQPTAEIHVLGVLTGSSWTQCHARSLLVPGAELFHHGVPAARGVNPMSFAQEFHCTPHYSGPCRQSTWELAKFPNGLSTAQGEFVVITVPRV